MSTSLAILHAITFVWLGMVLAISFLEAPLKFRAPGVSIPIGLGIGRLVFKALNGIEALLAVVVVVCAVIDRPSVAASALLGVAVLMLVVQIAGVRPALTKRSDAVLEHGADAPRSHAHFWYVGLELTKVVALIAGGVLLTV